MHLLKEFLKTPSKIGSIVPSSRFLSEAMFSGLNFTEINFIAEYGPGTGIFTRKLLTLVNPDAKIILIESNQTLYRRLKKEFKSQRSVLVLNDSAENIEKIRIEFQYPKFDLIISGIPFSTLPIKTTQQILHNTTLSLSPSGIFRTFQYAFVKKAEALNFFELIQKYRVNLNFPPAYVLSFCQKML